MGPRADCAGHCLFSSAAELSTLYGNPDDPRIVSLTQVLWRRENFALSPSLPTRNETHQAMQLASAEPLTQTNRGFRPANPTRNDDASKNNNTKTSQPSSTSSRELTPLERWNQESDRDAPWSGVGSFSEFTNKVQGSNRVAEGQQEERDDWSRQAKDGSMHGWHT